MVDNAFAHQRLAALYDLAQAGRGDLIHYEKIVEELGAGSVLDVGCGTGTLACRLARSGQRVVGLDPAHASLEIARAKQDADLVEWIHGDASTPISSPVDVAVMTGNVGQVFVTRSAWLGALRATHGSLNPDGHLVFEVRDPAYRGWEEWTRDQSFSQAHVEGEGMVESWVDLVEVALPLVTFEFTYRFERDGAELKSWSTLIFRQRDEIEADLAECGYQVKDVRDAPDRPGKEFVFIAQRLA